MKTLLAIFLLVLSGQLFAQGIEGTWKTIDDETGEAKSLIEVWFDGKKYQGKIIELLDPKEENPICTACEGVQKDQPILGMQIIFDAKKYGSKYKKGEILDPGNGKLYSLVMELENDNELKVRGFIGFALLGRTQVWHRVVDTKTTN
ncbi:DUF2147 domain-containing protein [Marinicellulosiphila megalodicopiae]|uniref:DUF2147 domain-containing protein n=1 Tax=Marinicellulosiphila megalodicopiae TaxID=2724896 RepID=UPI003BB003B8